MSDILVVDDEVVLARSIVSFMERRGFSADYAVDSSSAMALTRRERPRLVVLDVRLGRDNGMDLLSWFQSVAPETQIVVMTAYGEIGLAVDAMKRGARDFLTKPAPLASIATIAANLMLHDSTRPADPRGTDRILGRSSAAVDLRSAVRRLGAQGKGQATPAAVLITGPRGAGKATVARAVFESAKADRGALTEIDCSLDGTGLDAALARPAGGALLLRHVDALSLPRQARLMQIMTAPEAPWILATSAQNLARLERAGGFRADLLYRIQVGWIDVPALTDRCGDILPIAEALARQAAHRLGHDRPHLTAEARARLLGHLWPGNISELENCMERALLCAGNGPITADHIQIIQDSPAAPAVPNLSQLEEAALNNALAATRGNVSRAAALLGISRDTLRYRIRKHDISPPPG